MIRLIGPGGAGKSTIGALRQSVYCLAFSDAFNLAAFDIEAAVP